MAWNYDYMISTIGSFLLMTILIHHNSNITTNSNDSSPTSTTKKRVGVVLSEGFELLDAMGPYEALKEVQEKYYSKVDIKDRRWKDDGSNSGILCRGGSLEVEVLLSSFGSSDGSEAVSSSSGVPLRPEFDLSTDIDGVYFDLLVLGAGSIDTSDAKALAYLQKHHKRGGSILTVCTGARYMAFLGLLEDREATTNSLFMEEFRNDYPETRWISLADNTQRRFVRSTPQIVTTAGITAGIDGILDQIDQWCGWEVAEATRQCLEWPLSIETNLQYNNDVIL